MAGIKITPDEWEILKIKFSRKYNHLTDDDLRFDTGQEGELVDRLAHRVGRNREYVLFTLRKGLADLNTNRL